ncbi:uncharacterized protein F5147DRAFT_179871 [Suillus discolor]|uniref:Uncharacterized protein n=1 Tax=Suillus discolor TaxID=1912936 RepID=A0A9P7JTU7_9AGAM|nr:uncharacterized protein F5147DRAFT_179871 [Suillus discolor]KAG2108002.1 hypothetical protein F5147DRAFT_179871 [Suillus discolor]
MSASTPQISTSLGNYSFTHNPPTHQCNQHNKNINFGSSPPAMGSNQCAFQMLGPNDSSSSASSQHIATMSDMHAIAPMIANSDVLLWMSDSPLRGARSSASSLPAMGGVYLSPHALPTLGPIGHTSPQAMSSQRSMTASDARSIIPMMANSNATSWIPVNFRTAASDDWSQYLHNPGGARSEAPSHPVMGRVYLSPHAFQITNRPYFTRVLAMWNVRPGYTFCRPYDGKPQYYLVGTRQSQDCCLTWPLAKCAMCSRSRRRELQFSVPSGPVGTVN